MSEITPQLISERFPFDYNFHNSVHNSAGLYSFWLRDICIYVGMSDDLQRRIAEHSHSEDNPELSKYFETYHKEIKISLIYLDLPTHKLRRIESEAISELCPIANRPGVQI